MYNSGMETYERTVKTRGTGFSYTRTWSLIVDGVEVAEIGPTPYREFVAKGNGLQKAGYTPHRAAQAWLRTRAERAEERENE